MNNPKTLHVITKYFFPVTAGIEVNIQETYKKLVAKGWKVVIHTSKDTYLEKNSLADEEVIQGLTVKRYLFSWYGFFPAIDYSQKGLVCLHNFDIFPHIHILARVLIARLLGTSKVGVVVTPHGGFTPEWRVFSPLQTLIKRTYHYTLGAWLINAVATMVRAVSEWERAEMIKVGLSPNIITVIENGVEDDAYEDIDAKSSDEMKQKVASYGRYIIQIGRIYKIKNYETSIRAMAQLPPDVKLVILGPVQVNDAYKKSLESLVESLGLDGRVIFAGVARGVDKYYLIKHAQLMVHTAMWESFCNVVHEGMSQGRVCVVANNTALPYLVKDGKNGYCVETFDANMFATKMQYILEHQETQEIRTMKETNRVYGLRNSWGNVAEQMHENYERIYTK